MAALGVRFLDAHRKELEPMMFAYGIDSIMTTVNGIMPLEQAIKQTPELCYSATVRALRMIGCGLCICSQNN